MAPPLIVDLKDLGRADLGLAGGKGANLGELIRAGFPVPGGFVITTEAFRQAGVPAGPAAGAGPVQVPEPLWEQISERYRRLGGGPVAVRSSATAEDLPGATFAGQHATLLEISGEEALRSAVGECWASLWAERAVAYRDRQGGGAEAVMAVVVQRMVQPTCAGVTFTADPITSDRGVVAIEAAPGLGEAVVSGTVTPEHVVVDKARLTVVERRAGRFGNDGRVLADDQARELARLAISVEKHFGAPQDVEWAIAADGRCLLLQARPMTALRPAPAPAARPARAAARRGRPRGEEIARQISGELFPIRPYPLDVTSHTRVTLHAIIRNLFHPLGATTRSVDQTLVHEDGVLLRLDNFGPRPSWRLLYKPFLNAWRARRHPLATWESDPILTEGLERARSLRARDLPGLDWAGVLRTLDEALEIAPHMARLRGRYMPKAVLWVGWYWLLLGLARRFDRREALGTGIDTKTIQLNRELEAMAALVRQDPALREAFHTLPAAELLRRMRAGDLAPGGLAPRFEQFLDRFGSRETLATLATHPSWWNAPEIPLAMVQGMAAGDPPRPAEAAPSWERARDLVLADSILGRWPLRRWFLRALDARRTAYQLRENTHFYLLAGQPVIHACFKELGRRLTEAGVLEQPDDVFHLVASELRHTEWPPSRGRRAALREAVERRKRKREALGPWSVGGERSAPAEDGAVVTGMPGSPGTAEGPVRVITGPHQFGELRSGEVLVCPYTNPSWTPLFGQAVAVVADFGGANSHAAIVAREYGIPAVMGTFDGTRSLSTGQRVRVDGTLGRVYRAGPA